MEVFILIANYGDNLASEPIGAYREYSDCAKAKRDCELAGEAAGDNSDWYEIKVMTLE